MNLIRELLIAVLINKHQMQLMDKMTNFNKIESDLLYKWNQFQWNLLNLS